MLTPKIKLLTLPFSKKAMLLGIQTAAKAINETTAKTIINAHEVNRSANAFGRLRGRCMRVLWRWSNGTRAAAAIVVTMPGQPRDGQPSGMPPKIITKQTNSNIVNPAQYAMLKSVRPSARPRSTPAEVGANGLISSGGSLRRSGFGNIGGSDNLALSLQS